MAEQQLRNQAVDKISGHLPERPLGIGDCVERDVALVMMRNADFVNRLEMSEELPVWPNYRANML